MRPPNNRIIAWPSVPTDSAPGPYTPEMRAAVRLASMCSPTTLRWRRVLWRWRLYMARIRMPDNVSWRSARTSAMRSRTRRNAVSDEFRNQ